MNKTNVNQRSMDLKLIVQILQLGGGIVGITQQIFSGAMHGLDTLLDIVKSLSAEVDKGRKVAMKRLEGLSL